MWEQKLRCIQLLDTVKRVFRHSKNVPNACPMNIFPCMPMNVSIRLHVDFGLYNVCSSLLGQLWYLEPCPSPAHWNPSGAVSKGHWLAQGLFLADRSRCVSAETVESPPSGCSRRNLDRPHFCCCLLTSPAWKSCTEPRAL